MNTRELLEQLKPIERELSIAKGLTISAASAYSLLLGLMERLERQEQEEKLRDGDLEGGTITANVLRIWGDECDRVGQIAGRAASLVAGGYLRRAAETIDTSTRNLALMKERAENAERAAAEAPQLAAGEADRLREELGLLKVKLETVRSNPLKQLIAAHPDCLVTVHYPGNGDH